MAERPANDVKREEFRKYLEKSGVLEALTKVLVSLYEETEKPTDALQYLKDSLKLTPETAAINQEVEDLKEQVKSLTLENDSLKQTIQRHEAEGHPSPDSWPPTPDSQT